MNRSTKTIILGVLLALTATHTDAKTTYRSRVGIRGTYHPATHLNIAHSTMRSGGVSHSFTFHRIKTAKLPSVKSVTHKSLSSLIPKI